jgi:hypothetical protein
MELVPCFCRFLETTGLEATMTRYSVNDFQHWRDRAAAMRALAIISKDGEAREIMVRLAEDYDKVADRAETRASGKVPLPK